LLTDEEAEEAVLDTVDERLRIASIGDAPWAGDREEELRLLLRLLPLVFVLALELEWLRERLVCVLMVGLVVGLTDAGAGAWWVVGGIVVVVVVLTGAVSAGVVAFCTAILPFSLPLAFSKPPCSPKLASGTDTGIEMVALAPDSLRVIVLDEGLRTLDGGDGERFLA